MDIHTTWGDPYGAHYLPTASFGRRPSPSRQSSFNHHHSGGTSPHHQPSSSTFASRNRGWHDENQPPTHQQQRMAADHAYRETFASHERAVFQEEVRSRMRRRDAARNRALFRGRFYRRPEFYAITLGFLGLLYPILNQYVFQPYFEKNRRLQQPPGGEAGLHV
ncbi:hypothetical protein F4821DRAFT_279242 [Hypoxylon rubiginosum]|uniref:Uncharacterized protein n=1 Tax=Hypoxylon rubiginosum TaxID=110542 RepID=A0ACC0CY53_9PEZI|nr:hypothetical protein F4821DRAFT_279242 [Hypoxylon rubiginosum]